MLNTLVPDVFTDRGVILTSGIITLSAELEREDGGMHSYANLLISGLSISGTVTEIDLMLRESSSHGTNLISVVAVPSVGDYIELDKRRYTFVNNLTAVDQVLISDNTLGSARNLFCTLMASGLAGTDYFVGQTAHETVEASFADNPLLLFSKIRGSAGNLITAISSNRNTILPSAIYFYGGAAAKDEYPLTGKVSFYGNGSYEVLPVPYTPYDTLFEGFVYFKNDSGTIVNVSGETAYYAVSGIFNGQSDIPDFVEVANLSGVIDSTGTMDIYWDDTHILRGPQTLKYARPYTTGTPAQSTITLTDAQLAQDITYYIFVCMSDREQSPDCSWPRPTDARGTWYYAGRTKKTYYRLILPRNMYLNVWVGFGNKHTLSTTRTPIGRKSDLITY